MEHITLRGGPNKNKPKQGGLRMDAEKIFEKAFLLRWIFTTCLNSPNIQQIC